MKASISIIVPCYKAKNKVGKFIDEVFRVRDAISDSCEFFVYLIDDCCPDKSFKEVSKREGLFIFHLGKNQGVGFATFFGFKKALQDNHDFFIKMDADGQHPADYLFDLIPYLLTISTNKLVLVKGSRFCMPVSNIESPYFRRIGSYFLEPLARISLSYKGLTDIANGFISLNKLTLLYLISPKFSQKIEKRYLFECSLLKACSNLNVDIHEFHMEAIYGEDWESAMNSIDMIIPILKFWIFSIARRINQHYFLKLNLGTLFFIASFINSLIASIFFIYKIYPNIISQKFVSAGNANAFVGSILIAIIFFIFFVFYDLSNRKKVRKIYFRNRI